MHCFYSLVNVQVYVIVLTVVIFTKVWAKSLNRVVIKNNVGPQIWISV